MTTWARDELYKIGTSGRTRNFLTPTRWHTAQPGDNLGRPRAGRPLSAIRVRTQLRLVPRRPGAPRRSNPGRQRRERCELSGRRPQPE
jgi:hypothetical protein